MNLYIANYFNGNDDDYIIFASEETPSRAVSALEAIESEGLVDDINDVTIGDVYPISEVYDKDGNEYEVRLTVKIPF